MASISSSDEDFRRFLIENKYVLVKFYADWCGTCRLFHPYFLEVSEDDRFQEIMFLDINIDESPNTKNDYKVDHVPAFALFKEGKIVEMVSPSREDEMKSMVKRLENYIND